jgi:predicted  nucleic acid-binding Zn-ribbon protein
VLTILQDLLHLQSVDVRLHDVRGQLAVYPKKLADADARVAAAKAQLDKSKAAQLAVVKDRKKYELDVEAWKDKARKYRDQTSQVKTNEAYKALQHETENAEKEISKAEDRLIEQMVAGEEYDRQIKQSEQLVKEVEAAMGRERAQIQMEKAAAEKESAELNAQRALAVEKIPENLLDHYERLIKKHNGIALAEVRDEKCAACGMRIRPHVFQEMRRANSEEMFHCETCTRILYYIEPEPSEAEAAKQAAQKASVSAASNRET